jgi:hypothetical protein
MVLDTDDKNLHTHPNNGTIMPQRLFETIEMLFDIAYNSTTIVLHD